MNGVLFWEGFLKFAFPSLLLVVGLFIGVMVALLAPISDEERKKAAKEIDEKMSRFVGEVTRPLNGFGMIGLKIIYFYVIGMFIILVAGTTVSDILGLPTIYDTALRIATVLAEYFPIILCSITIVYIGQKANKVFGFLLKRFMNIIDFISNLQTSSDSHE